MAELKTPHPKEDTSIKCCCIKSTVEREPCDSQNCVTRLMIISTKTPERNDCSDIPYNPFSFEIESLSMPSFSPSVFLVQETVSDNKDDNEDKPFRWSIDQLATLQPVNIDETFNHLQHTFNDLDEEREKQAQTAIRSFFLQNSVVPSPWGVSVKHVTFSPNAPSPNYYLKDEDCSQMSVNNTTECKATSRDVWTQTNLVIPANLDLEKILGEYYSFTGDQALLNKEEAAIMEEAEALNISSLRRKLFSPERLKEQEENICETDSSYKTPEKQSIQSVSSCSSHFSSSPIIFRNVSILSRSMKSPPLSPITAEKSFTKSPLSRRQNLMGESKQEMLGSPILRKFNIKSILKSTPNDPADRQTYAKTANEIIQKTRSKPFPHASTNPATVSNNCSATTNSLTQFKVPEVSYNKSECGGGQYSEEGTNISAQDTGYQTTSMVSSYSIDKNSNSKHSKKEIFSKSIAQKIFQNKTDFPMEAKEMFNTETVESSFTKLKTPINEQTLQTASKVTSSSFDSPSGMEVEVNGPYGSQIDLSSRDSSMMQVSNSSWNPSMPATNCL